MYTYQNNRKCLDAAIRGRDEDGMGQQQQQQQKQALHGQLQVRIATRFFTRPKATGVGTSIQESRHGRNPQGAPLPLPPRSREPGGQSGRVASVLLVSC